MAKKKLKMVDLVQVKGNPLVDPYTRTAFSTEAPRRVELTNWVECQMEAGLLAEYKAPKEPEAPKVAIKDTAGEEGK